MDKSQTHNLPGINKNNFQTLRVQLRKQLVRLGIQINSASEQSSFRQSNSQRSKQNTDNLPNITRRKPLPFRELKQTMMLSCREAIQQQLTEKELSNQVIRGHRYDRNSSQEASSKQLKGIIHKKILQDVRLMRYSQRPTLQQTKMRDIRDQKEWGDTIRIMRLDNPCRVSEYHSKGKRSKTEGQGKPLRKITPRKKTEKVGVTPWQVELMRDTRLVFN